jgi:hypothetical protein
MKAEEDILKKYRDEIRLLREENELLRRSARFFGALAERLHASLQEERRLGQDRRAITRSIPDRRQPGPIPAANEAEASSKGLKRDSGQ